MGLYCDVLRLPEAAVRTCWEIREDEAAMVAHLQQQASEWVELDKAWHGIHVLLNPKYPNAQWPSGFLFMGGTSLTDRDWERNYGVAVPDLRTFLPEEARAIHGALQGVTEQMLLKAYDPDRLTRLAVYPRCWETRTSPVSWVLARFLGISLHARFLAQQFTLLQQVTAAAVKAGEGLAIKYHQ